MRSVRVVLLMSLLTSPLVACTSTTSTDTITVFAAASLTEAFTKIGAEFEREHPGSRVVLNFASSTELATHIVEGAPADIFASADTRSLDTIRMSDVAVGEPRTFATNSLEIIVEPENPKDISSIRDLARPDLRYITCDPSVPIGAYSADVLARAGVDVTPTSYEDNVKGIVTKVVLGEADAGIVYRSDIVAAGSKASGIVIPDADNVVVSYPIAALGRDPSENARAFLDFVTSSPIARSILTTFGFGTS